MIRAAAVIAAALVSATLPTAAAELGRGGAPSAVEPTAGGDKPYLKSLELECEGTSCVGQIKGKSGRTVTITEVQCAINNEGQAQGGQIAVDGVFVELLPVASRATNGVSEAAIVKTPTNFSLKAGETALISTFAYGEVNFSICFFKGVSKKS